ncbi:MAG TPA: D-alanyl-D-alanine carboxypeptidase family protein [Acidisphaera sp.]|nr:D-alanyl-D-alanine carboxypeptidase family protein [Acidisphaera sp.]
MARNSWRGVAAAIFLGFSGVLVAATVASAPAMAQIGSDRYASIVMDAGTGAVLSAANADEPRYPASLTKLMTLYLTFEAVRDHRIALTDLVPVSAHAASMSPTKLGLLPGMRLTVEEAVLGLVTKSANDAASALGELLGGDEDRFAEMMTLRARSLGMTHTVFRNASGLPDPDMVSTARDLALLARHLINDFPNDYGYFSTPGFTWHGRLIRNHDHMLQTYPGADGLKTGYTQAAGCNLVTSAQRDGVRLIGVVLGAQTGVERDIHMAQLLDAGFEHEGVPSIQREPVMTARLPTIIGSAQAAPVSARTSPRIVRHIPAATVAARPVVVHHLAEPVPAHALHPRPVPPQDRVSLLPRHLIDGHRLPSAPVIQVGALHTPAG